MAYQVNKDDLYFPNMDSTEPDTTLSVVFYSQPQSTITIKDSKHGTLDALTTGSVEGDSFSMSSLRHSTRFDPSDKTSLDFGIHEKSFFDGKEDHSDELFSENLYKAVNIFYLVECPVHMSPREVGGCLVGHKDWVGSVVPAIQEREYYSKLVPTIGNPYPDLESQQFVPLAEQVPSLVSSKNWLQNFVTFCCHGSVLLYREKHYE